MKKKITWLDEKPDDIKHYESLGYVFIDQPGFRTKVFYPENIENPFPEEVETKATGLLSADPVKGFGEMGSIEWHKTNIIDMSRSEVEVHVKKVTGKAFKISGRLDFGKNKALKAIEDHLNG